MAIIYDFPTHYKEKLKDIDNLLEKRYIDQAICVMEDWLQNINGLCIEGEQGIRKKLLSCYLLKREYKSCNEMVLQFQQLRCLDIEIAAYDIVSSLLQNQHQEANEKQVTYQQELQMTPFAFKNLIELVFHLKTFYEEEWLHNVEKKFKALLKLVSYEKIIFVLADMQEIEAEYFLYHEAKLRSFFEIDRSQILKTLLFELLCQKQVRLEVEFVNREDQKKLYTTLENLKSFYEEIFLVNKELRHLGLDDVSVLELEQQVMMFYRFVFPFHERMNKAVVLEELKRNFSKVKSIKYETEDKIKTNKADTVLKVKEYLLSLSLLR